MKEKEYYPIVAEYFNGKGYKTFIEFQPFPNLGIRVDILAIKGDEIVSIEVKRRSLREGLGQLYWRLKFSDYVYLALPKGYAERIKRKFHQYHSSFGIGLLSIDGDKIEVVYSSKKSPLLSKKLKNILLERLTYEVH